MTVNSIEVTVNTCTCIDVFTIITTKDQSGGIYNNFSLGGQRFMVVVNKPRPRPMSSDSVCLLPSIPAITGTCAITITYVSGSKY